MLQRLLGIALMTLIPLAASSAQSAGVLARMGFGARGIAVGNALAGDASGLASPWYNPALAPYTIDQNLSLSAALMTQDRQLQFVELSTPLQPRAGIAAGLIHAGVRNIDLRDDSGYHTGTATTDDYAFFIAFGVRVNSRASVGIGLQLFRSDLHPDIEPVQTIGLDVGLSFQALPQLHLGIVLDDLLARYSWDTSTLYSGGGTTSDIFPTRIRLGAAWESLDGQLQIMAEYESQFSRREIRESGVALAGLTLQEFSTRRELTLHSTGIRLGAEYQLVPILSVRGGLSRLEESHRGGPQPTAGFMVEQALGLLVARIEYTVLLEPWALGTMHIATIRFFL